MTRSCIAIDLKSFYASVECAARDLDPLKTNLVVADVSRTDKTICLAISPSLKAHGLPGRARLFEVKEKVRGINAMRLLHAPGGRFTGKSANADELAVHPEYALDFIIAVPHMQHYIDVSAKIVGIYLRYVAPEDLHVYSIDEVLMDVTPYLRAYNTDAHDLARRMIRDIINETGITATAGIGTNLYLAKIAMDIEAKHIPADADGVRIAELDEFSYRRKLWHHKPLTDFWRVGGGTAKRLRELGLETMGDVAKCSLGGPDDFYNEDLLYRVFGVNAELLIDHAWGCEPVMMADIKAYHPEENSLGSAQVLSEPYPYEKAKIVVREMAETLALRLAAKRLGTDQLVLDIAYDGGDIENYKGQTRIDFYGRTVPKPAHGSVTLPEPTSSTQEIVDGMLRIFAKTVDPSLFVRRIGVTAGRVQEEKEGAHSLADIRILKPADRREIDTSVSGAETTGTGVSGLDQSPTGNAQVIYEQMDLFTDYEARERERAKKEKAAAKEKSLQQAMLSIRKKYGGNAILKGTDLQDGATQRERNGQIGGHKA